MIAEETVLFEDTTPYHDNKMYKSLLRWHLPLLTRSIYLGVDEKETKNDRGSFSFLLEERRNEKYKGVQGKEDKDGKKIKDDEEYKEYNKIELPLYEESIIFKRFVFNKDSRYDRCFFTGCKNNFIRAFVANGTMFILFDVGDRFTDIRSLDKGVRCEQKKEDDDPYTDNPNIIKKDIFLQFLKFIEKIVREHNITQIVLNGHSNGSSAATITAFILMAMFKPDYRQRNKNIIGSWYDDIEKWQDQFSVLNKSVFLVCTGTIPILFTTQAKFKDFYDQLQGRYVSVLSGFSVSEIEEIYIDYFGSPIYDLYLYKYGIYYGKIEESEPSEEEDVSYRGVVSFYKIIINPDYSTYDDWVISFDAKHRRLFSSQNSARDTVFPGEKEEKKYYSDLHLKGINDRRGISFKTPYTKPPAEFTNVDTDKFLEGFDRKGNRFVNCDYPEYLYPYNRPGIKNCLKYRDKPHQLSFYRYLLSIFIYDVKDIRIILEPDGVFEEGGQSLFGAKRSHKKRSNKKRSNKKRSNNKRSHKKRSHKKRSHKKRSQKKLKA
jgi:hypothetical protein